MIKKIICIECPKSCVLSADIENCRLVSVSGNECLKGEKYAVSETENPTRILTSTILAEGLSLKMLPVKTDKPMPKVSIKAAIREIRKIRINKPINIGDIIVRNFLGLQVNLIATRDLFKNNS